MGMIFIGVGTAHMGMTTTDREGNVISKTSARWEEDPAGGCVAMGLIDPESLEQMGDADIFGDWDAAGYLKRALELIHPNRQINVPDLEAMIQAAAKQGVDICDYCNDCNCRDCIVSKWKEGCEDE